MGLGCERRGGLHAESRAERARLRLHRRNDAWERPEQALLVCVAVEQRAEPCLRGAELCTEAFAQARLVAEARERQPRRVCRCCGRRVQAGLCCGRSKEFRLRNECNAIE